MSGQLLSLLFLLALCHAIDTPNANLANGNCTDPNCVSCPFYVYQCEICGPGFYRNYNQICVGCKIPKCTSCYESYPGTTCFKCSSSYYISSNNTCISCEIPHCDSCAYQYDTNTTKCLACLSSYYLDNNHSCITCGIPRCDICMPDNIPNNTICWKCISSYYLTNNTCITCGISQCDLCSPSKTTNATQCSKCKVAHYYRNNTCLTCDQAIPNCLTCNDQRSLDSPIICYRCNIRYIQDSPTSCTTCATQISHCNLCYYTIPANYTIGCKNCANSYYLKGNTCLNCGIENCETCQEDTNSKEITCTCCNSHAFTIFNNSCVACNQVIPDCDSCIVNVCTACANGKTRSEDRKSCITPDASSDSSNTLTIVLSVVGGVVLLGACVGIYKYLRKKKTLPNNLGVSLQQTEGDQKM